MPSWFYAPPPMPQGTTPPQKHVIPPAPDVTADFIIYKRDVSRILNAWAQYNYVDQKSTYTTIASLIPASLGAGDVNLTPVDISQSILSWYRVYVPPPQKKANLNPILIPIPDRTPFLFDSKAGRMQRILTRFNTPDAFQSYYQIQPQVKKSRLELVIAPSAGLIAFQANAFQTTYPGPFYAFQGKIRFVSFISNPNARDSIRVRDFLTFLLGPLMKEYQQGTPIVFECSIYDPSERPSRLFDPDSVSITLIRPDDTIELNAQLFSKISQGFYRYIWQSSVVSQLGIYALAVDAINGPYTAKSIDTVAFKLVS